MDVDISRWKTEIDSMKQILKQTPITFNGVDGWEVLIKDDEIRWDEEWVCGRCMYVEWDGESETLAPCSMVHGCMDDWKTYFKFEPM